MIVLELFLILFLCFFAWLFVIFRLIDKLMYLFFKKFFFFCHFFYFQFKKFFLNFCLSILSILHLFVLLSLFALFANMQWYLRFLMRECKCLWLIHIILPPICNVHLIDINRLLISLDQLFLFLHNFILPRNKI